ncbi:hypothetical protein GON26_06545 [Flavobacterium sp. GA093]|uniref:Uncharacterized protein n=1 Tax=Flavobacterium hydrocarbonoxydans TaxID=2683249 RepID=A0A6I4NSB4_9FLAO|nr:hypothetical protein [Flavobacterium hydrocarbonoxydans]MWB94014.1 hypothetical protein [Flavobacterium hydrocarbonoxydans]
METATKKAVPKTYIPEWIKLDFYNNSNLKTDIQNRISKNIETDFLDALNNMKGDNKSGFGVSFSEITLLAMAYFYSEIFTYKIKDKYYTIEMVKGFIDANNLTTYTAIYELDEKFYSLVDAPLFKHCWLIIQSAWFFNSQYFGHHQHIDYVNHYINTGEKLPIDKYNFDRNYLDKKYSDVDNRKSKSMPINGFTLVSQWYYGILFLICKELKLSTSHFNISVKDHREYNPLPKTSRQLRPLAPFKLIECDIKSAFPTFLDVETGANLKDDIYNNLMLTKGITRSEAKILFNTICNSGKYKSKEFTKAFFLNCGYTDEQSTGLLYYTHNEKYKFISFMTDQEETAINNVVNINNLQRGARLHDALLFIDDKTKPQILRVDPNCDFGLKELNRPVIRENFYLSDKRLPYAYINSLPNGLNMVTKHDFKKPQIKGKTDTFIIYIDNFEYISAGFNLNNYNDFVEEIKEEVINLSETLIYSRKQFVENPNQIFISLCENMLDVLFHLNKRKIKPLELELILKHIRRQSNYVFNVRATYLRLIKYNSNGFDLKNFRKRDFDIVGKPQFKKNIDFLNEKNKAIKEINILLNYKNLIDLMRERIQNNDYGFLSENTIIGHKRNNLLTYAIVKKFNLLCTGSFYKPRKTKVCNVFINDTIKSLQTFGISQDNKQSVYQLFLILSKIAGAITELEIQTDTEIQNQLKLELIEEVLKITINNIDAGVNCFEYLYQAMPTKEVKFNTDIENSFDTDLSKSIFNCISTEEAFYKGEPFFTEYLKYHKIEESKQAIKPINKPNQNLILPEFDFDNL